MNNLTFMDFINFLRKPQNSKSFILIALIILGLIYTIPNCFIPEIQNIQSLKSEIATSEQTLATLKAKRDAQAAKLKSNQMKIENIPVKIYKSLTPDLPIESSSIDFVSSVISMIEHSGNSIIDISYKIDSISAEQKQLLPANISVVELAMSLSGTYADLQEFILGLYEYDYLATVKSLKITPLRENKNIIETNIVVWLYVSK